MTAITYRKPAPPLAVLIGTDNRIVLRVPVDTVRGQQDRTPEKGRRVRELVQALVAYKQAKRK